MDKFQVNTEGSLAPYIETVGGSFVITARDEGIAENATAMLNLIWGNEEAKLNAILRLLFWNGKRTLVVDDGGEPRYPAIWYVMDEDNDGVPVGSGATPLEAIEDWYEEKA